MGCELNEDEIVLDKLPLIGLLDAELVTVALISGKVLRNAFVFVLSWLRFSQSFQFSLCER